MEKRHPRAGGDTWTLSSLSICKAIATAKASAFGGFISFCWPKKKRIKEKGPSPTELTFRLGVATGFSDSPSWVGRKTPHIHVRRPSGLETVNASQGDQEHLAEAGIEPSVGSVGDSYDNALAETINGLYKAEVIHRRSWRNREQVELATLDWVHWFNHQRLLGPIGHIPPAEAEAAYYNRQQAGQAKAA